MELQRKCDGCGTLHKDSTTLKTCSYCHNAYYCNRMCQEADWRKHKIDCKKLATMVRVDDVIKYYFGEYMWCISDNIHAHYSYSLNLENSHTPTFRLKRSSRVENIVRSQEYSGTWYPFVRDIKDKRSDYIDIFAQDTKINVLLKSEKFLMECIEKESTVEFILKFGVLKSSPKHLFYIACQPFSAFNEHRIVLTGIPYELQKVMHAQLLNGPIVYDGMYKWIEYELDFFHSTKSALQVFDGKKKVRIGINEIVSKLTEANRWNDLWQVFLSKCDAWIEVAKSMEDSDGIFEKVQLDVLKELHTILDASDSAIDENRKTWKIQLETRDRQEQ
jgi:hypothetical protein